MQTEKKELVRYSMSMEHDTLVRKEKNRTGQDLTKEEMDKLIEKEARFQISMLFQSTARYYADYKFEGDPPEVVFRYDIPMPPMEIVISMETQLWDSEVIMKIIEK